MVFAGRTICGLAQVLVLAWATFPVAAQEPDPDQVLEQIASSRLDIDGAVRVRGLLLNAGLAELYLDDGIVYPAEEVAGRVVEMIFLGKGRIHMEPPDDVEGGQLELFTGDSTLDEPFEQVALVAPLEAASKLILGGREAVDPSEEEIDRAREAYRKWKYGKVREELGVDGTLLMAALDDPIAQGFFAAWFRTEKLGDFFYILKPDDPEQVTLGQFVSWEMSEPAADRVARLIRKEQRRGSLIGVVRSDLGIWDTWVRSSLRTSSGQVVPGGEGFEPTRYTLEVELADGSHELAGTARIELQATTSGRRFVPLRLGDRWVVRAVHDAAGLSLDHFHARGGLVVYLGRPVSAGETVVLEIDYAGQPFVSLEERKKILFDTLDWYPQAGRINRASYDVTLRWPAGLSLVASGERVEGGVSPEGRQWERRHQGLPAMGFSFEVGDFDFETVQAGHVAVRIAHHDKEGFPEEARREIRDAILGSLDFYEQTFGPYPLDYLTVVTVPRDFSQGLLGFVTLAESAMEDLDILSALVGNPDRRVLVAHELAHQWWGHLVGWASYRDQWISEAMANYAARRYAQDRIAWGDGRIPSGPTTGWYGHLTATTSSGRPVESIGPMTLGARLDSSQGFAYQDVVYKKGAVVLETLARYLGEARFSAVVAEVVEQVSNRVISTEQFFELAGRIAGTDLDWFVEQYVDGTGIPEVHYSYDFTENDDGSWTVRGEAKQFASHSREYRLVTSASGSLDVIQAPLETLGVAEWRVVAPMQILVHDPSRSGGPERTKPGRKKKRTTGDATTELEVIGNAVITGRVIVEQTSTPIEFQVRHEPKILWLDRNREVFARFYSEERSPKRAFYRQGTSHHSAGRAQAAEAAYRKALASELLTESDYQGLAESLLDREERGLDAETHLHLARLYTDRKAYEQARQEIELARETLRHVTYRLNTRMAIYECRIDLLEGDAERAFKRLKKIDASSSSMGIEGYLLFAIAAKRVGKEQAYERALRVLRARDVDVSLLTDDPGRAPSSEPAVHPH